MEQHPLDASLDVILPAIAALSDDGKQVVFEYLKSTLAPQRSDQSPNNHAETIGLFADEPELADEVAREAMELRTTQSWREFDE
jgi:hypothetical protein